MRDVNTSVHHTRIPTALLSFFPLCEEATTARYWMTFLVFSVFPAPDSPLKKKERKTFVYKNKCEKILFKMKIKGTDRFSFQLITVFLNENHVPERTAPKSKNIIAL